MVARWLDVKRPSNFGCVILGVNELARTLAKVFKENNQDLVCIDSNPDACRSVQPMEMNLQLPNV
jgi:Trk K+ transport system NAD-binding subunit